MKLLQVHSSYRVLHTRCCRVRTQVFVQCGTVARSSSLHGPSSSRQQKKWDIVFPAVTFRWRNHGWSDRPGRDAVVINSILTTADVSRISHISRLVHLGGDERRCKIVRKERIWSPLKWLQSGTREDTITPEVVTEWDQRGHDQPWSGYRVGSERTRSPLKW